jgi:multisubunit Na+/H+ antiporter MnhB subunit
VSAGTLLDVGVAALLVGVAGFAIATRSVFAAVVAFIAYGLMLALAWVRLAAVDVALTEVAVGALTGVLLLGAVARLRGSDAPRERTSGAVRITAALLCASVASALAAVVLTAPDPAPTLAPLAARHLPETGLGNPVTAVLLAHRAVDTLLEKVVLLVGLLGVWSLAPNRMWGGRPGATPVPRPDDPLAFLARTLAPIGIVVGVYLVWNGADRPGGAFPGSSILAAMWVLARMAGLVDAPALDRRWLRVALVAGPLAFFAVGFAGFFVAGSFLAYPAGWAKPLIVAIEVPMTISVAATLAMLLEGPPLRPVARAPQR